MWEIPCLMILLSASSGEIIVVDTSVQVSHPNIVLNNTKTTEDRNKVLVARNNTYDDDSEKFVVVTEHGPVRGYQAAGTEIWQFFDIPYGVFSDDAPFQEPTKPASWKAVREITEHRSRCPQIDSKNIYSGSADCLTLSVFVPTKANNSDVLFHIHEGDFIRGSGDPKFYGPDYLVSKDVIVVLPNYRLGPMGFLCLRNETAPGNAALKDLTLALNWTKENIEAFGGNPLNIVVSGSDAGAALAEYLALSPKSQDYVSKVITESGCVLSYWAIDRNPTIVADKLAKRLEALEVETGKSGVVFNVSIEKLVTVANGLFFRPCVENEEGFLTETPWNLLQHKFNKSFMLGAADSGGMIRAMEHTEESVSALNDDFTLFVPNDLAFEKSEEKMEIGKKIKVQYFGNQTITLDLLEELALCHTDCAYLSPGVRNARLLTAAGGNVYFYEFSFVANGTAAAEYVEDRQGASLGDSLKFVFKQENAPAKGSEELKMIDLMTNLWVSFIKTGIPSSEGVVWDEFIESKEDKEEWLLIGSTIEMKKGFHVDRLHLWTEIYNEHFVDINYANQLKLSPLTTYIAVTVGLITNAYV